jgi:hypothetical protein
MKNHRQRYHLDNQASHRDDPVNKAGNARESSWVSQFTSAGRTETDKANLVVNTSVDVAQWAARVTLIEIKPRLDMKSTYTWVDNRWESVERTLQVPWPPVVSMQRTESSTPLP